MTSSSPSQKTVLVAADTAFVRDRFKTALTTAGHRAVVVKSVAQLLARVRADLADLDLIVLDLRMPHASGVDLVTRIRKLDEGHLPILVFSGTVTSAEEVKDLAAIAPHLFPETFNRRDSPRVVMGIPISYRAGGKIAAALSLNLSRGGMAVRTSGPLSRGAALRLRFALPGSKKEMQTEALVCWSDQKAGMGLRFTLVNPHDQVAINEFVDAHFFRSVKGEKPSGELP
jgi:uncharacterized protein (TIGR02266 family)